MPGAPYTNQPSYSTPAVERAEADPLSVFAPSRLCVKMISPKNAYILRPKTRMRIFYSRDINRLQL